MGGVICWEWDSSRGAVHRHLCLHGTPSEAWGRVAGRVRPCKLQGARAKGLNAPSSPLSFIPLVAFSCALFVRQGDRMPVCTGEGEG